MLDVALILALLISGIAKIVVVLIAVVSKPDPDTEWPEGASDRKEQE